MVQTRFALIMFIHMVAHKAACHAATLVKGFFEISIDMVQILLLLEVLFIQNNLKSKICPLVLCSALNPDFSSAVICLAWVLSVFKMTLNITLLKQLMKLIIIAIWAVSYQNCPTSKM